MIIQHRFMRISPYYKFTYQTSDLQFGTFSHLQPKKQPFQMIQPRKPGHITKDQQKAKQSICGERWEWCCTATTRLLWWLGCAEIVQKTKKYLTVIIRHVARGIWFVCARKARGCALLKLPPIIINGLSMLSSRVACQLYVGRLLLLKSPLTRASHTSWWC